MILFFTVAVVHFVALISPGPDFFFVSQVAVRLTRRNAFSAVFGIVLGIAIWAVVALLGLHLLLQQMAWLHQGITVGGGLYLCWLGLLLLRSSLKKTSSPTPEVAASEAAAPPISITSAGNFKTFLRGLFVNLANPKALVYFGSVFSLFVGPNISPEVRWSLFLLIVAESLLWFSFVAAVFALPTARRIYQRAAKWIDRIAGCLFIGFGLRLIFAKS